MKPIVRWFADLGRTDTAEVGGGQPRRAHQSRCPCAAGLRGHSDVCAELFDESDAAVLDAARRGTT